MTAAQPHRPDAIDAEQLEASEWVLRITSGADPEAEEACAAWRAADPRRDTAFHAAWRAWHAIGDTSVARVESWRDEATAMRRSPVAQLRRIARSRPARFGVPVALAASIAAFFLVPQPVPQSSPELKVDTAIAETRALALDDGSRVTVGARSSVDVQYAADTRRVLLTSGQAFFEVAHDPSRPFVVLAGNAEIRVTGTKFDVIRIGDDVRVSVLEGRVEVRDRSAPGRQPEQVLIAGQRSELQAQAGLQPPAPTVAPPGEWRTGRLYYADAPLSEILADAERYSPVRIRVADASVARLRLTASFRTGDIERFVSDIEAALPVDAQRGADGSIILSPR